MNAAIAKFLPSGGGDQLTLGIAGSVLAHVLLVAAVVFWPSSGHKPMYLAPAYNVRLLSAPPAAPSPPPAAAKPAAKPEVKKPEAKPKPKPEAVAKPKPTPKPTEAIGKKSEVKPEPKPKPKPKPKVDSAAQAEQELARRLAQLERRTKTQRSVDSAISRIQSRVAGRARSASGTAGSAGGGRGNQVSMRFQVYHTEVWQRVHNHWVVPDALIKSTRGLAATVIIVVRRDGSLVSSRLERSSGNSRFDQTALRAVKRASPYPRLPAGYRGGTYEMGLHFRPEDH